MYVLHSMRKENVVQEAQPMLTNPRDAFSRQSRSPNMVPFDMIGIVTLSLRSAFFEIFDFKKCRDLEIRVKGHPRSPKATRIDPLPDFLLTLHSNRGPISYTVSEIDGDFGRKSHIFATPVYLTPLLNGFPLELCIGAGVRKT